MNSANNGPYGDALVEELIPYLEREFRLDTRTAGRVLTGNSTGGREALAIQIFHPTVFNGAWAFQPDLVDFRRYEVANIYEDGSRCRECPTCATDNRSVGPAYGRPPADESHADAEIRAIKD